MNKHKRKKIIESYNRNDNDDISDAMLLQIVADECHCDISDVVNVLYEEQEHDS